MSVFREYLNRTIYGMQTFFEEDKSVVILLSLLLLLWLKEKKTVDNIGNRMLLYTVIMVGILLFPLTAVAVVVYQTAFYDYAWSWSMVPMLAVIAYVAVLLYEDTIKGFTGKKKAVAIILVSVVLFVCGNQGILQTVEEEESQAVSQTRIIIEEIEETTEGKKTLLWAPKSIMEQVRRQSGELLLVYGRDMWDEKSAAYDYEDYGEALVSAYEWMELLDMLAEEAADEEAFEKLYEEYSLSDGAKQHLETMLDAGVNAVVLPLQVLDYLEEAVTEQALEKGLLTQRLNTEQYVIFMFK